MIADMLEIARRDLETARQPIEYEADVQYPGAPLSREQSGGDTSRRLLRVFNRDPLFLEWLRNRSLVAALKQILGPVLYCPLAHHNCLMTKHPDFSSDTGWHQDVRYWSFSEPELVSAWLALGPETTQNGCLKVIPHSHRSQFAAESFDQDKFFREDLVSNRQYLEQAIPVELQAGDVLLFHARLLHAASRNFTSHTKYSLVFTFHGEGVSPHPGSRSASLPEVRIL